MTAERITHAGGVVYRWRDGQLQYLLVGPKKETPDEWLLPKGHIEHEKAETAEDAAVREIREEAGIVARPIGLAGSDRFTFNHERIFVHYFLMEGVSECARDETRRLGWFSYEDAHELLTHPRNKRVLEKAEALRLKILADSSKTSRLKHD